MITVRHRSPHLRLARPLVSDSLARGSRLASAWLLASASLLAGCVDFASEDPTLGADEQALLQYTDQPAWGRTIRVCFAGAPGHAREKAWVKQNLTSTWGRYAQIDFTGFGTCAATVPAEPEVSITIDDVAGSFGASAMARGHGIDASRQRGANRGVFVGWSKDGTAPRARVGSHIVHEFGHILGFAHDQNSPGNLTGECWWDPAVPLLEPETAMIGAYDPLSIMNYCAGQHGPNLSPGDKVNIGAVYGARPLVPGRSDIVWHDAARGLLGIWEMLGTAPSARGAGIEIPAGYTLLGTGRFAGYSALFRDAANQLVAWKLNGTAYAGYRIVTGASVTTAARRAVVATGDMDGDGITDVIWKDPATGEHGIWMMDDGPTIRGESVFRLGDTAIGPIPAEWRLVGVGDFDGDGGGDILWHHMITRELSIWHHQYRAMPAYPNGASVSYTSFATGTVLPLANEIAAIGDFDGDSVTDIAWSEPNGNLVVTLTKRSRLSTGVAATLEVKATMAIPLTTAATVVGAPIAWRVAGTGDFDGNGTTDLLWRSPVDGAVATSPMRAGGVSDAALHGFGGKCLSTNGFTSANGTRLVLWDCLGQPNQQWTLMSDGTLRGLGGKCVSTHGDTSANGTGIILWACLGQPNQKWSLEPNGTLRGLGGRVLSTSGYTSANGTNLVLWDGVGQDNQKWAVAAVIAPTAPFAAGASIPGTLGRDPTPR